jgi:hypothetical protein
VNVAPSTRDPEFYLSHSGYVRALARHILFDEHLAADVEQQVWLAALEHAPRDTGSLEFEVPQASNAAAVQLSVPLR